jgi:hypothetical protein
MELLSCEQAPIDQTENFEVYESTEQDYLMSLLEILDPILESQVTLLDLFLINHHKEQIATD